MIQAISQLDKLARSFLYLASLSSCLMNEAKSSQLN